jgi:adenylate cyclase
MTSAEVPGRSPTPGAVRKLTAILSADVEGYSRLMGEDEAATIQTLTVYRAIIESLVQQHRGRVVDSPGDNMLAEFASVVDAMQCAVAMQQDLNARNMTLPPSRRMKFRVGINVGDVVVDGARIYGSGVNLAARLESLAEAGGICIAGSVYEQIKTKLVLNYEDLGTQAVKNIADTVRVYRVRMESDETVPRGIRWKLVAATPRRRWALVAIALVVLLILGGVVGVWQLALPPSTPLPDKPSIAVLPFVNMSGDREQEYFSDGMTEDLITEFSRMTGLLVIARTSVFTYKGKAVRPEQVSRELGVRYLLEGSVRKASNRVRINAQLVDATTGYHLWADTYDRDLQDIFAIQAEIAGTITKTLAVRLTGKERGQMGRPYTTDVAWPYFQRALELYRRFTPQDNAQARTLFEKAIDLDPKFSRAYAYLGATHRQDGNMEWTADRETSEDLAYRMTEKAVELAKAEQDPKPSLPHVLYLRGFVHLYAGRLEEARADAEEAVRRDPNFADAYALYAHVLSYLGRPDDALPRLEAAIIRNPSTPFLYSYYRGVIEVGRGFKDPNYRDQHFLEAKNHLQEAVKNNTKFRPARAYLAAVLMHQGDRDGAKKEMDILAQGRPPRPAEDLAGFEKYIERSLPYKDPAIRAFLIDLWRRADQ